MSAFLPKLLIIKIYSKKKIDSEKNKSAFKDMLKNSLFNNFISLKLDDVIKSINLLGLYYYKKNNIDDFIIDLFNSEKINEFEFDFDDRYGKLIFPPTADSILKYKNLIDIYNLKKLDIELLEDYINLLFHPKELSKEIISDYIQKVNEKSIQTLEKVIIKIKTNQEVEYSELETSIDLLYEFSKKPTKLLNINDFDFRIHNYNEEFYITTDRAPESQVLKDNNEKNSNYVYAFIFIYEVYDSN